MKSPSVIRIPAGVALGLALTLAAACGGVSVPPELLDADEARIHQHLEATGQRDLRDKLAVGRERYEQRLAFRGQLIAGMRANLEERREVIPTTPAPAPVVSPQTGPSVPASLFWLAVGLLGAGVVIKAIHRSGRGEVPSS